MTEYCSHWYPRYILLKRIATSDYILVDNYLGCSTPEHNTLTEAINSRLGTYYTANSDLGNLEYLTLIEESDLPITKQTHPELCI